LIDVFNGFIFLKHSFFAFEASRSVLDHAEIEYLVGGFRTLPFDLELVGVPALGPPESIVVDWWEKEFVEKPQGGAVVDVQSVVDFEVGKKPLPLATETVGNIVPYSFNASVMYASTRNIVNSLAQELQNICLPSPNIRSTTPPSVFFHPAGNPDVFSSVITANSTGTAVYWSSIEKKVEDGRGTVVVIGAEPNYEPRMPIDKAMDDNLPPNQSCNTVSHGTGTEVWNER